MKRIVKIKEFVALANTTNKQQYKVYINPQFIDIHNILKHIIMIQRDEIV